MIDVKTAFLLWVIQAGTLAVLLIAIWLHARDQRHFLWFGVGFGLQALGLGMVGLRDQIPDFISIQAGNVISLLGFICWGTALCAFDGRRPPPYVAAPAVIWILANLVPALRTEMGYRMAIYDVAAAAGLVTLGIIALTARSARGAIASCWPLSGSCRLAPASSSPIFLHVSCRGASTR